LDQCSWQAPQSPPRSPVLSLRPPNRQRYPLSIAASWISGIGAA
jgi:hypothetical protein